MDKINGIWSKLSFEFENFNQAGGELRIFRPFDTVQEILDNDTSKILSLLSQGKSVEVFKENLNDLKTKLNRVDTVMNVWEGPEELEVTGQHLPALRRHPQPAAGGYQDVRPEKRPVPRNHERRAAQPHHHRSLHQEKRVELEEKAKSIEDCEKKLNIYLEQKKKAFARFYFVSNQTLIDILSNRE